MFVLAQQVSEIEFYWTGLFLADGEPQSTMQLVEAAQFCTEDSAARCSGNHKQLDGWKVAERFAPRSRSR
jgi:hypothetical protein